MTIAMFRSLKKAVIERAMKAEMSEHLGYECGESKPAGQSNQRNGASGKTVITDEGPLRIDVPRDRDGSHRCAPLRLSNWMEMDGKIDKIVG